MSFNKLKSRIDEVAATEHNMHETTTGGGGRVLLDEDYYYGYLCQFVQWGNHPSHFQGKETGIFPHFSYGVAIFHDDEDVSKYTILDNGTNRFGQDLKTGEKARAVAMFRGLNVYNDDTKTHIAQFLGEARTFKVLKKKSKDGKVEFNQIDFAATSPAVEGRGKNRVEIELPMVDAKDIKVFFWDHPTIEDWDALYIEPRSGERDDGTKYEVTNFLQNKIVSARNFEGSKLQELLEAQDGGFNLDHYQVEQEKASTVAEDTTDDDFVAPEDDTTEDVVVPEEEVVEEQPKPKATPKPTPRPRPAPRPRPKPTPEVTEEDDEEDIPH